MLLDLRSLYEHEVAPVVEGYFDSHTYRARKQQQEIVRIPAIARTRRFDIAMSIEQAAARASARVRLVGSTLFVESMPVVTGSGAARVTVRNSFAAVSSLGVARLRAPALTPRRDGSSIAAYDVQPLQARAVGRTKQRSSFMIQASLSGARVIIGPDLVELDDEDVLLSLLSTE